MVNSRVGLFTFIVLFVASTNLVFATDVPKGGTDVDVSNLGNLLTLSLTNKTCNPARDITVTIYNKGGQAVPNINEMDIIGKHDAVDDNLSGSLYKDKSESNRDDNEGDENHVDSTPDKTCRTILENYETAFIACNDTVTLNIVLSGNAPSNSFVKVSFSHKNADDKRHYTKCVEPNIPDPNGKTPVPIPIPRGTKLDLSGAVNHTGGQITYLYLLSPTGNPFVSALVEPPYDASTVEINGRNIKFTLNPPVPDSCDVEYVFELTYPPADDSTKVLMDIREIYIPTLSEWGLIIMTGLLLTVGAVVIVRRRLVAA
jgi:hypothetical protein